MFKQANIITFAKLLVFTTVFASVLNHKELFSIIKWDFLPVRVLSALILVLGTFIWVRYLKNNIHDFIFYLFAFLSTVILSSAFLSSSVFLGLSYTGFFFLLPLSYIVNRYLIENSKNYVNEFLSVFILSALFSCFVVIFQIVYFYSSNSLFGAVWPVPGKVPRFGAFFWDINHFGMFLVIAFWLGIYKIATLKKLSSKYLASSVPLFFIFCLLLTSSRSAMLGLGFSIIVFTLIFVFTSGLKSKPWFVNLVKWVVAFLPIILFINVFVLQDFIRNFFFYRIHSFFTHFILLKVGFNLFTTKPLLGVGAGNFDSALRSSPFFSDFALLDPGALNYKVPIHSVWFQFLTESGIFALTTFLLISILILGMLFNAYLKSKNFIYLILLSSIVSMLVSGIFYSYNMEFYWLFFTFVSAVAFSYYKYSFNNIKKLLPLKALVMLLAAVGLFLYFLYAILLKIDVSPSLQEIYVFNLAKQNVSFLTASGFYLSLLKSFQYMFGHFAYSGRLLSLIFDFTSFLLVAFSLNVFIQKTKYSYALSLSLVLLVSSFLGLFYISPASYYLYLFSLILFIITFLVQRFYKVLVIEVNKYFVYTFFIVGLAVGLLNFTSFSHQPLQKDLSKISKDLSRKFSVNTFDLYADSTLSDTDLKAVSFYLEPKTAIKPFSNLNDLDKNIILFSTNENTYFSNTHTINYGKYNVYVKYIKGY